MFDTLAEITPRQDGIVRVNWTIVLDCVGGETFPQLVLLYLSRCGDG